MKLQSTAYLLVTFQSIIHYKVENLISRCLYNTNCFCHRQLHSFATKAVTKKIYKYCPKSFHRNVFCNCCCCEAWPLGKEACNLHGRFKEDKTAKTTNAKRKLLRWHKKLKWSSRLTLYLNRKSDVSSKNLNPANQSTEHKQSPSQVEYANPLQTIIQVWEVGGYFRYT